VAIKSQAKLDGHDRCPQGFRISSSAGIGRLRIAKYFFAFSKFRLQAMHYN
jgi:hypothetical protein